MNVKRLRISMLLAALAVAVPAVSQVGHPAKGSWSGYWGPDDTDQRRMLLLLDWEDNRLTGTINPGRNGTQIDRATLEASNWTLTIEAAMRSPASSDSAVRFIATGKLENLGSWTNRRYSGTYQLGNETGEFLLSLN
jgi:hypothetical protein